MKKMLNSVVMVALLGLFVVGCADRAESIEGDDLLVLNGVKGDGAESASKPLEDGCRCHHLINS